MDWKKLIVAVTITGVFSIVSVFLFFGILLAVSHVSQSFGIYIFQHGLLSNASIIFFANIPSGLILFSLLQKALKMKIKNLTSLIANVLSISLLSFLFATIVLFVIFAFLFGSVYKTSEILKYNCGAPNDNICYEFLNRIFVFPIGILTIQLILPYNPVTFLVGSYIAWKYFRW